MSPCSVASHCMAVYDERSYTVGTLTQTPQTTRPNQLGYISMTIIIFSTVATVRPTPVDFLPLWVILGLQ
jgi:hypothetical protein